MGSVGRLGLGEVWPVEQCSYPTDVELINDHLKRKLGGLQETCQVIPEFNIYQLDPQDLFKIYNEMSDLQSDGRECFFYCIREEHNRKTPTGFWKDTGEEHTVWGWDGVEIGFKKIYMFHEGQQPLGKLPRFSMQEYHLNFRSVPTVRGHRGPTNNLVLCRITNGLFKETFPRSSSSEVTIELDGASRGPSNIANQASPQIPEVPGSWWHDDEHQHEFTCDEQFHGVGGCISSSSSTVNCNPDYDDGIFLSELWD